MSIMTHQGACTCPICAPTLWAVGIKGSRVTLDSLNVPKGFRQIGVKQRSYDGRSEYLWWETPPEGTPILIQDTPAACTCNGKPGNECAIHPNTASNAGQSSDGAS